MGVRQRICNNQQYQEWQNVAAGFSLRMHRLEACATG
jgi:hypothetical protein